MSNFLAIATASAGLRQIIDPALQVDVPGTTVTIGRPPAIPESDVGGELSKVNIYLYRLTPNATWRNADLPTYSSDGSALRQRPQTALDLHYLLSFYGDQSQLVPERLMGSVARTLHGHPVLTQTDIADTIAANPVLGGSDLADQIEQVKLTPDALSLEEMSKLWTVFQQVAYTTSVVYHGTVILIESAATPLRPLPVEARNLYVLPSGQPLIDRVVVQTAAGEPLDAIEPSVTLLIQGTRLRGDVTRVRIGSTVITPLVADTGNTQIKVNLDPLLPADLRAGVQPLQIIHELMLGTPAVAHTGTESNVIPLVIHPLIIAVSSTTVVGPRVVTVTVTTDPVVGKDQRAVLMLNVETDPASSTFVSTRRVADTDILDFDVGDFPAGTYEVHLQIDGAMSLSKDGGGAYVTPTVVIT